VVVLRMMASSSEHQKEIASVKTTAKTKPNMPPLGPKAVVNTISFSVRPLA
jgi:hypothetical protein